MRTEDRPPIGREHTPRATSERRNVHVRIAYAGSGQPGPLLVQKRLDLEKLLHADNAGTILRSEAGGGAMEIVIVTADADRTREIAWKHVNQLGLGSRTTIRAGEPARRGGW